MLGFMLTTAFVSMWITNTATTAMMTPIMEAVLKELDKEYIAEAIEDDEREMNGNVDDFEATMEDKIKELNQSQESINGISKEEVEMRDLGLHEGPSRSASTKKLVDM